MSCGSRMSKVCKPVVIERVSPSREQPMLLDSSFAARGKYGMVVELPAGIWNSADDRSAYGTLMFTDLVVEFCMAFVKTFASE